MINLPRNVCESIVANNLCIGCGVCAAVCPPSVLDMEFNVFGSYIPVEYKEGCLEKCDLCLRACPFSDQDENEDTLAKTAFGQTRGISHAPESGYYLDCYVGYSTINNHRLNGASGGMATWFLEKLLNDGVVDKVVCVTPNNGDVEKLYHFDILNTAESVRDNSKSCYYPVEISDVVSRILNEKGRYIIVGLPCFIKSLRLAMRKNKRLQQRIVVLVGLVCGQTKSKFFVEYLASLLGGGHYPLRAVQFRIKDSTRPATDYGVQISWQDRNKVLPKQIFWTEGISKVWTHDYFKPNCCNFCDDVFAETADVVFMDAWLPKYKEDYRGHSLLINRNEKFKRIFEDAKTSTTANLETIDINEVIKSQKSTLRQKREMMQYRLYLAEKDRLSIPRKRLTSAIVISKQEQLITELKMRIRELSFLLWAKEKNASKLDQTLKWKNAQINLLVFIKRFVLMITEKRIRTALKKRFKFL